MVSQWVSSPSNVSHDTVPGMRIQIVHRNVSAWVNEGQQICGLQTTFFSLCQVKQKSQEQISNAEYPVTKRLSVNRVEYPALNFNRGNANRQRGHRQRIKNQKSVASAPETDRSNAFFVRVAGRRKS